MTILETEVQIRALRHYRTQLKIMLQTVTSEYILDEIELVEKQLTTLRPRLTRLKQAVR